MFGFFGGSNKPPDDPNLFRRESRDKWSEDHLDNQTKEMLEQIAKLKANIAEKEVSVIWGFTDGGTNNETYTKEQCLQIEELYNLATEEPKEVNIQSHTGQSCVINLDEGTHTNLRTGVVSTLQRKVNLKSHGARHFVSNRDKDEELQKNDNLCWGYVEDGELKTYAKHICNQLEELYFSDTGCENNPRVISFINTFAGGETCTVDIDKGLHINRKTGENCILLRRTATNFKPIVLETLMSGNEKPQSPNEINSPLLGLLDEALSEPMSESQKNVYRKTSHDKWSAEEVMDLQQEMQDQMQKLEALKGADDIEHIITWAYMKNGAQKGYDRDFSNMLEMLYCNGRISPRGFSKEIPFTTNDGRRCLVNLDEGTHTILSTGMVCSVQRRACCKLHKIESPFLSQRSSLTSSSFTFSPPSRSNQHQHNNILLQPDNSFNSDISSYSESYLLSGDDEDTEFSSSTTNSTPSSFTHNKNIDIIKSPEFNFQKPKQISEDEKKLKQLKLEKNERDRLESLNLSSESFDQIIPVSYQPHNVKNQKQKENILSHPRHDSITSQSDAAVSSTFSPNLAPQAKRAYRRYARWDLNAISSLEDEMREQMTKLTLDNYNDNQNPDDPKSN